MFNIGNNFFFQVHILYAYIPKISAFLLFHVVCIWKMRQSWLLKRDRLWYFTTNIAYESLISCTSEECYVEIWLRRPSSLARVIIETAGVRLSLRMKAFRLGSDPDSKTSFSSVWFRIAFVQIGLFQVDVEFKRLVFTVLQQLSLEVACVCPLTSVWSGIVFITFTLWRLENHTHQW